MIELEFATEFVKDFAGGIAALVKGGRPLDEQEAFRGFCEGRGVEATAERLELARDVVLARRELLSAPLSRSGRPSRRRDPLAPVSAPLLCRALEAHGWRRAFLCRDVHLQTQQSKSSPAAE